MRIPAPWTATVCSVQTTPTLPADEVSALLSETGAVVRPAVPLARLTTLRVGGPATVVECPSTSVVRATIRKLDAAGVPVLLLAGGSNVLVADDPLEAVVVRMTNSAVEFGADHVVAGAGAEWDSVVAASIAAGFGGLECLSGIPGSAGGTPVQNVGAYGVEVAQVLRRVQLLDRDSGEIAWVRPDELQLSYRSSRLKHSQQAVVLAVDYALDPSGNSVPVGYQELARHLDAAVGDRKPAAQVRAAVLALRAGKGMVLDPADHDTWSAGSFFTNPVLSEAAADRVRAAIHRQLGEVAVPTFPAEHGVKFSAGWLIERAGFGKGFPGPDAPARLSTKHTLALTNRGTARAADLIELAREVRDGVLRQFGVELFPEPVLVGTQLRPPQQAAARREITHR